MHNLGRVLACGIMVGAQLLAAPQSRTPRPAIPVEPIAAILDLFRAYPIVALGEGLHGNVQGHAFRLALIRDPRFAATVDDIVVEWGNSRYQQVMDRFVRGEDIPTADLRHIWQDTTQTSGVWDRPIYEEFFRAVRALNATLPGERRLRVLLGDPPVDWKAILEGTLDIGTFTRERDAHAADLIQREVLAKHRRAIVIYGDGHLFHGGRLLVGLLESRSGIKVFTIATAMSTMFASATALQPDLTSWTIPSLALIRGTALDAEQLVYRDGLLYLGPPATITFSRLPAQLCADAQYIEMRLDRVPSQFKAEARVSIERECRDGGSGR